MFDEATRRLHDGNGGLEFGGHPTEFLGGGLGLGGAGRGGVGGGRDAADGLGAVGLGGGRAGLVGAGDGERHDRGWSRRSWNAIEKYGYLCRGHVIADLRARKLRDLSASDVDRWLAEKAKILSTSTVQRLHECLNRAVNRAMARDKVKRNVVALCGVPKGHKKAGPRNPSPLTRPGRCSTQPRTVR